MGSCLVVPSFYVHSLSPDLSVDVGSCHDVKFVSSFAFPRWGLVTASFCPRFSPHLCSHLRVVSVPFLSSSRLGKVWFREDGETLEAPQYALGHRTLEVRHLLNLDAHFSRTDSTLARECDVKQTAHGVCGFNSCVLTSCSVCDLLMVLLPITWCL